VYVALPVAKFTDLNKVKLCTGLKPNCEASPKSIKLSIDGEKNGLVFLESDEGTTLTEHDILSFATTDSEGKVLEYRRFKIGLR
jgi:hypothetical protein